MAHGLRAGVQVPALQMPECPIHIRGRTTDAQTWIAQQHRRRESHSHGELHVPFKSQLAGTRFSPKAHKKAARPSTQATYFTIDPAPSTHPRTLPLPTTQPIKIQH